MAGAWRRCGALRGFLPRALPVAALAALVGPWAAAMVVVEMLLVMGVLAVVGVASQSFGYHRLRRRWYVDNNRLYVLVQTFTHKHTQTHKHTHTYSSIQIYTHKIISRAHTNAHTHIHTHRVTWHCS